MTEPDVGEAPSGARIEVAGPARKSEALVLVRINGPTSATVRRQIEEHFEETRVFVGEEARGVRVVEVRPTYGHTDLIVLLEGHDDAIHLANGRLMRTALPAGDPNDPEAAKVPHAVEPYFLVASDGWPEVLDVQPLRGTAALEAYVFVHVRASARIRDLVDDLDALRRSSGTSKAVARMVLIRPVANRGRVIVRIESPDRQHFEDALKAIQTLASTDHTETMVLWEWAERDQRLEQLREAWEHPREWDREDTFLSLMSYLRERLGRAVTPADIVDAIGATAPSITKVADSLADVGKLVKTSEKKRVTYDLPSPSAAR